MNDQTPTAHIKTTPLRIPEALPEEYVLFLEDATEDTWFLWLNTFPNTRCPGCDGDGCSACQGTGLEGADR